VLLGVSFNNENQSSMFPETLLIYLEGCPLSNRSSSILNRTTSSIDSKTFVRSWYFGPLMVPKKYYLSWEVPEAMTGRLVLAPLPSYPSIFISHHIFFPPRTFLKLSLFSCPTPPFTDQHQLQSHIARIKRNGLSLVHLLVVLCCLWVLLSWLL
jgi:hypothetical protein